MLAYLYEAQRSYWSVMDGQLLGGWKPRRYPCDYLGGLLVKKLSKASSAQQYWGNVGKVSKKVQFLQQVNALKKELK